jgi:hypothetical protein
MSQADIYQYLKEHPHKRFTTHMLAKIFDTSVTSLTNCIGCLRRRMSKFDPKLRFEIIQAKGHYHYVYWYNPHARKCLPDLYKTQGAYQSEHKADQGY